MSDTENDFEDNIAQEPNDNNLVALPDDEFVEVPPPADEFADGIEISIEEIIQAKVSKKIRDLNEFLTSNKLITEKGDQRTNIIDVSGRKCYNLPENLIDEFFTSLDACRKESRMLHYSERQETETMQQSGIMIDFDRYQRSKESQLTDRHFDTLVLRISKLLCELLDIKEHEEPGGKFVFRVFIIKKPGVALQPQKSPGDAPLYKDGFHILIPEICVMKGFKRYFINEIAARGIIKSVFRDIDHIDEPEKMLDKMSATNPVHFLGCSKPGRPAYPLTHAYEMTVYLDEDEYDRRVIDVATLLGGNAPSGTAGVVAGIATAREGVLIPINLTYELSLGFFSHMINGKPTWLNKRKIKYKAALETKLQLLVEKTAGGVIDEDDMCTADNSVDILTVGNAEAKYIKNLLAILDPSYASEYEKWFKVICAIAHTNLAYKPLAMWFSQRVPDKWSPAEVERVWLEATNGKFGRVPATKRSIIFWARESSPQRYLEIQKENYIEVLAKYVYQNEGRVEHSMAAKVTHAMICDKFVVDVGASEKTGRFGYIWLEYVMKGQAMKKGEVYKWRREADPDNVHLFICEHLPKIYAEQTQRIRDRKDNAPNEAEAKYWANVEKTFRLYTSKLSNDTFQAGIVRQAQYRFRQRGFLDELDSYEDVIGVGNGVLKTGIEPKLIKGFHEYKISKFTETDYVPHNPTDSYQKALLQWALDIFPEPDVNAFMWLHASTSVSAYESACILLLLVGGGQNGKTSWVKMIHNTLGNMYGAAGKATLLTSPMERGDSANSAQMQMRGKTFVYMDEFNKLTTLNDARMKSMVTPGWQSGRDLHEKQTNFKNTCNPLALSNFDFGIETTDHGTWRRIYYYKSKVKFCKNPNPSNRYEKKGDAAWESKNPNDPMYKQAMLSLLVHYNKILWRDYGGDLKNIPVPTIMRETEAFRNRQDSLNKFITQMIVHSPGCDIMSVQTLSAKYAEWHGKFVRQGVVIPTSAELEIENSRLAPALEYRMGGMKYLVDHRVRETIDEPLRPGEEMLVKQENEIDMNADVKIDMNVGELNMRANALNAENRAEDTVFMRDLIRNAPKHIQNTIDHDIPGVSSDDINDVLGEL